VTMPAASKERRLRILLLSYFKQGHSISRLSQEAQRFPDFSRGELKRVARALADVGLITRIRGATKGTVFLITQDGLATLAALEELENKSGFAKPHINNGDC
jgi:hypothetical protein